MTIRFLEHLRKGLDQVEVRAVKFTKKNRASIAFELGWKSSRAAHRERVLIPKADLWKDVVPRDLEERLAGAAAGDVCHIS